MSESEIVSIPDYERPKDPKDYTGRTINGYRILEKLGAGTFGVVYVGERDGKKFALKLLPTNDPLLASTLQKELDAQEGLKHPNIREIYEFCPDARFDDNGNDPLSLLVMEYVNGTHLKVAEVDNNAFYPIVLHVKNALKAAHNQGIISKDVKPTNILVTKDGQAKVCDFGLSKKVEEHSMQQLECSENLDSTEASAARSLQSPGTYGYFPPGEKADSPAYDLFSFGITLYQMVLQRIEFPDADVFDDVKKKAEERGLINPEGLAELIKNLTLKKHKRPKDFSEVEETAGWKAIDDVENKFWKKVSTYLKEQIEYCDEPVENQEELVENLESYLKAPRSQRLNAAKNVLYRFSPKDREFLAKQIASPNFYTSLDSDELLRLSLTLFSFEELVKISDLTDPEQYQKMWDRFNKASELSTELGFEDYFEQQEMELWAKYADKFDQAEAAEKTRKELETEQSQNIQEANFPTYQKYIQLINQLNPAKIKDELADNIAYSAWKEGLAPEYVDYIVESIARRREKGLLRRVAEGLYEFFGKTNPAGLSDIQDPFADKSKQEIREELKKYAEQCEQADGLNNPFGFNKDLKLIKKAGRKYNVFVEDIIEETVRKAAKRTACAAIKTPVGEIASLFPISFRDITNLPQLQSIKYLGQIALYSHKQNVFIGDIFREASDEVYRKNHLKFKNMIDISNKLENTFPKAFTKRPDYSQLERTVSGISKSKVVEYRKSEAATHTFIVKGLAASFSALWAATYFTDSFLAGALAGVAAAPICAFDEYFKNIKTMRKWDQQTKVQESIDATVKKLMQGKDGTAKYAQHKKTKKSRKKTLSSILNRLKARFSKTNDSIDLENLQERYKSSVESGLSFKQARKMLDKIAKYRRSDVNFNNKDLDDLVKLQVNNILFDGEMPHNVFMPGIAGKYIHDAKQFAKRYNTDITDMIQNLVKTKAKNKIKQCLPDPLPPYSTHFEYYEQLEELLVFAERNKTDIKQIIDEELSKKAKKFVQNAHTPGRPESIADLQQLANLNELYGGFDEELEKAMIFFKKSYVDGSPNPPSEISEIEKQIKEGRKGILADKYPVAMGLEQNLEEKVKTPGSWFRSFCFGGVPTGMAAGLATTVAKFTADPDFLQYWPAAFSTIFGVLAGTAVHRGYTAIREHIKPAESLKKKTSLLSRIKSYFLRDIVTDFDGISAASYIIGLPIMGGVISTAIAAKMYDLPTAGTAGAIGMGIGLTYNAARILKPIILPAKTKNKETLTDKVNEAEQKEEPIAEEPVQKSYQTVDITGVFEKIKERTGLSMKYINEINADKSKFLNFVKIGDVENAIEEVLELDELYRQNKAPKPQVKEPADFVEIDVKEDQKPPSEEKPSPQVSYEPGPLPAQLGKKPVEPPAEDQNSSQEEDPQEEPMTE
ncbi:serine/threonine protein kinase [Candidatus Woesearchaeota archaeon]|nr:serine/threonine protein kinase [Candidatus Woesearchaeota archaeon]